MQKLVQRNRFRQIEFTRSKTGILVKEEYSLSLGSKESFVSFLDLGIDIVQHTNREGIPTLLIVGVMMISSVGLFFKNLLIKLPLALFFLFTFFLFAFVIIFTIQKYMTSTYEIIGGKQTLTLLRYYKGKENTLKFIELLKSDVKAALIHQYNDFIIHFKPNDKFEFKPINNDKLLRDEEYKLLKVKTELLLQNLIIDEYFLEIPS